MHYHLTTCLQSRSAGKTRACSDIESVVCDLMTGRFDDPVQVVAFNTLEHWLEDLSADVASEIQARCDIDGAPLPAHLEDFVGRHARRVRAGSQ